MFPIGAVRCLQGVKRLYRAGHSREILGAFQDAGAEELGDKLQLVSREPEEKPAGARSLRTIGTGAQRRDQSLSVTNHTEWL